MKHETKQESSRRSSQKFDLGRQRMQESNNPVHFQQQLVAETTTTFGDWQPDELRNLMNTKRCTEWPKVVWDLRMIKLENLEEWVLLILEVHEMSVSFGFLFGYCSRPVSQSYLLILSCGLSIVWVYREINPAWESTDAKSVSSSVSFLLQSLFLSPLTSLSLLSIRSLIQSCYFWWSLPFFYLLILTTKS